MNGQRPAINIEEAQSAIQKSISDLLREREWLIDDYSKRFDALIKEMEVELQRNLDLLSKFGYDTERLAPIPFFRSHHGVASRKLSGNQIKQLLSSFMKHGEEYSSTVITNHLGIVYRDFRKFVIQTSDFIGSKGKNRGRVYFLK